MKNAQNVLADAKQPPTRKERTDAEQYYMDNEGQMETATESPHKREVLELLAEQFTNPVQSVDTGSEIYFGIIDYTEGDEWYGFEAYDERSQGKRVIGVREIPDATKPSDLPHATAGDPTGSFNDRPNATYKELAESITDHYNKKYGGDRGPPEHAGPPSFANGK